MAMTIACDNCGKRPKLPNKKRIEAKLSSWKSEIAHMKVPQFSWPFERELLLKNRGKN